MMHKRRLGTTEVALAKALLTARSLGQVARFFNTNKPSVLKSIGDWKYKSQVWRGYFENGQIVKI